MIQMKFHVLVLMCSVISSTACASPDSPVAQIEPTAPDPVPTSTFVATEVSTEIMPTTTSAPPSPTPLLNTATPVATTQSPQPQTSPAPVACQRPPDDYTQMEFNGHILNARTLWMLHLTAQLYSGRGNPLNVTQGSYVDDVAASFGTHAGGGAVDISIRVKDTPGIILSYDEMVELVRALRQAGFAAWLRLPEDLNPPTPLHIHAIAVGDSELSSAARRQLDGPEGYFRGLDGVPPEQGGTKPDRYGDPVLCDWMIELGFKDLR